MKYDVVIAAGDGHAAKKVFKKNKALLDIDGKPIINHIISELRRSKKIGKIVVVGPREKILNVLDDSDADVIEQKRNLMENGWEGFLRTIPEYCSTGKLTQDIIDSYHDKCILGLPGDVPLLTCEEIEEFISKCDMDKFDYVGGYTKEEIMKEFGPRKGRPGIKMATFHTRDGNVRQNNMHMVKPFVLQNSIDLGLSVYEFRYQKEFVNIIRGIFELIKFSRGHIIKTLWLYFLLQISTGLSAIGLEPLSRITRWPVTINRLERMGADMLNARFALVETTIGGAAIDVDNEKDFVIMSLMYKAWMNLVRDKAHHLAK